jgi:hypothetical protein
MAQAVATLKSPAVEEHVLLGKDEPGYQVSMA